MTNTITFEPFDDSHMAVFWDSDDECKHALRAEVWGLNCVTCAWKGDRFYPAVFLNDKLSVVKQAVKRAKSND